MQTNNQNEFLFSIVNEYKYSRKERGAIMPNVLFTKIKEEDISSTPLICLSDGFRILQDTTKIKLQCTRHGILATRSDFKKASTIIRDSILYN